jgi:glutathione S-transferase
MRLTLYAHPFSSYCQKALIAFYENGIPFEYEVLGPDNPRAAQEHARLWPVKRMPVLVADGRTIVESSVIIEFLQVHCELHAPLVPRDADAALDVRTMDRFFDNYVMTPMQKIVLDHLRAPADRDAYGVAEAKRALDTAYAWLDERMPGKTWASGDAFSLADCAAAPSLFYADWVHAVPERHPHVRAYRRRLLERPSYARAVDEARPYRPFFPPGAPDRD